MNPCVYLLRNKINQKIYIGKALNFNDRMRRHAQSEFLSFKGHSRIINAIQKYGWQNFSSEILEYAEKEKLLDCEEKWIIKLGSTNDKIGYNILSRATDWTGHKHSKESRLKMSESSKKLYQGENNPMFGRKHSAESIRKMSDTRKLKAKRGVNSPNYGKKFTEQRKQKLREAWVRRKLRKTND